MNFLFELYKDKCLKNSEAFRSELRSKYNLTEKQLGELYVRIVKYQVTKYGNTLDGKYIIEPEHKKIVNARKARRLYYKKKGRR